MSREATRDWGGLGKIVDEAKQLDVDEKARPLLDCPVCGTPLDKNSAGAVNCPMGHYRAPSDARRA